jgi:cytochrome b561
MASMERGGAAGGRTAVYSALARQFHWITAGFVLMLAPVGMYMVERGKATNFDALTNTLYSSHKLAGFLVLWFVLARLIYRLTRGAPAEDPAMPARMRLAASATHWAMYALLILVPLLGWLGVQRYPALNIFGLFDLPAFVTPDQAMAERIFMAHKAGAMLLAALVTVHVGAALFHHLVRKDNVLRRMLPGLQAR